jgi:hypothetical protein
MTHASLIDENLQVAVMSNIGFCGRANRSKKILEEPNHGTLTSFIIRYRFNKCLTKSIHRKTRSHHTILTNMTMGEDHAKSISSSALKSGTIKI